MNNLVKRIFKSLICAALTLPAVVSCYDDSQLWDKVNELEKRVDSLQVNLNEQASALSDLMGSGTSISSCNKNADGSYTIELSNGTDFTVLPAGTKFSSLVTYMKKDGKNTWATYDADGNLVETKSQEIPILKDYIYLQYALLKNKSDIFVFHNQ